MILQKKQKQSPEHEFLLIDAIDRSDCGRARKFILEHTTTSSGPPVVDESEVCPTLTNKAKKFAASISSLMHTPSSSPESSLAQEIDHLSLVDKSTVSLTRAADFVSDSLDKVEFTLAFNVLSEENNIRRQAYLSTETVRIIKPKFLTLFKLIVLADVVHRSYPLYLLLREQCFFFASIMVFAVEVLFGVSPTQDHSNLADMDKAGC